ncbi:transcriptional regulator, GntR family [Izhakiella capsodis]|uniref:Transcriptional regulator, GntR family n=1 Tax=Izhakiella capsodis TaxID=1367852 RepID=A0A1I4ZXR5_9GAMM|nr:FCD domain-containing protein [Izhakiella capsodis]SFN55012.1 transcriptional regulator, GntR family [Izhakiella capsodis]
MGFKIKRQYRDVGELIKQELVAGKYLPGSRLPPERSIAERFGVGRAIVREAMIMLEVEGYVAVRKGSGIYALTVPAGVQQSKNLIIGPFELLQARQLLESNIAEFAALRVTPGDIKKMRAALDAEKQDIESGSGGEGGDKLFHQTIAEATHNTMLLTLWKQCWENRDENPMWRQLHERITSHTYRREWLNDHQMILAALQKRDAAAAKLAMWGHLENVKQRLMTLSDVDAPEFDGYLFESWPVKIK